MVSCDGCGGEVEVGVGECPYCGKTLKRLDSAKRVFEGDEEVYHTSQDADGMTYVRFGDGQTGDRPTSGDGISSHYRQGSGVQGNVTSRSLEEKIDRATHHLDRVPDPSRHKGSKDVGVALVESMAAVGDLLAEYQGDVSHEAHLSTDDRDRISVKEARIRPKLEAVVAFCETVDSKTQKKMGLSDSDIRKIRTTAAKALHMTGSRSGECSQCGTSNRPGSKHCRNCGSPL
jgi:hypothetical protein